MDNYLLILITILLYANIIRAEADLQKLSDSQDYLDPLNDPDNDDTSIKDQEKRTIFNPTIRNYAWAKHVAIRPSGTKQVIGVAPIDLKYTPVLRPVGLHHHGYHYNRPKLHFHIKRPIVQTPWKPIVPVAKPVVPISPPVPTPIVAKPIQPIIPVPAGGHINHVHLNPVPHIDHVYKKPHLHVPAISVPPAAVHINHVHQHLVPHADHLHSITHVNHVNAIPQPVPIRPSIPVQSVFEVTRPDLGVLPLGTVFSSPVLKEVPAPQFKPIIPQHVAVPAVPHVHPVNYLPETHLHPVSHLHQVSHLHPEPHLHPAAPLLPEHHLHTAPHLHAAPHLHTVPHLHSVPHLHTESHLHTVPHLHTEPHLHSLPHLHTESHVHAQEPFIPHVHPVPHAHPESFVPHLHRVPHAHPIGHVPTFPHVDSFPHVHPVPELPFPHLHPAVPPQPIVPQISVPPGVSVEYHGNTNFVNLVKGQVPIEPQPQPDFHTPGLQPVQPPPVLPHEFNLRYPQIPQNLQPNEQDIQGAIQDGNYQPAINNQINFQQNLPQPQQEFPPNDEPRYQLAGQVSSQHYFQGENAVDELASQGYVYQKPDQFIQPGQTDVQLPLHLPQHPGFQNTQRQDEQYEDSSFEEESPKDDRYTETIFKPSIQLEPPNKK